MRSEARGAKLFYEKHKHDDERKTRDVSNTNTIELNGKRYDALSGRLLDLSKTSGAKVSPVEAKKPLANNRVFDDVIRSTVRHKTVSKLPSHPLHPAKKPAVHHPARPMHPHHPKPAVTLMRSAVAKPSPTFKPVVHAQTPAGSGLVHISPKPRSAEALDAWRLDRAHHVAKSHAVSRFSDKTSLFVKRMAPVAVKTPARSALHPAARNYQPLSLAEAGMARATAHEQPAPAPAHHRVARKLHVKPRTVNLIAGITAFILLIGFFAYQNAASIDVRIASARAGIHASVPGSSPGGFALKDPVIYGRGQVTLSFHSNSDDRQFSIIQQASSWDSSTLRSTFIASLGEDYQTLQAAGRTIYTYGQGNATWVSNGIWYEIDGNANLSSSQILGLATSM